MREGGEYQRQKGGKPKLIKPATRDHPDGNRAREAPEAASGLPSPKRPAKAGAPETETKPPVDGTPARAREKSKSSEEA